MTAVTIVADYINRTSTHQRRVVTLSNGWRYGLTNVNHTIDGHYTGDRPGYWEWAAYDEWHELIGAFRNEADLLTRLGTLGVTIERSPA